MAGKYSAVVDEARIEHNIHMELEELQLLSTADPTRPLEDKLLYWQPEEGENKQRWPRLSFALAVRKRRFAGNSLLIGSRYGVWSTAERRFIKKTNLYHYHHLTRGIRDARELYVGVFLDGFYDVGATPRLLYKLLFIHPRRTARILSTMSLYYHVFMAKDRRMECCLDDVYRGDPGDDREELCSLRHRLVDVYRRRMTPAQRHHILVSYRRDVWSIRLFWGIIVVVLLVLFVIIAWLLR